jgi:NitT/TauT family transport system permease protein
MAERQQTRRHRGRLLAARCLIFVAWLGSWELAGRFWLNPTFVSYPSQIAVALYHGLLNGEYWGPLGGTLYETFAGFVAASVLGILAAALLYEFTFLYDALRPFITALNSVPRIALAPLFVLWFGLGSMSRIVLVFSLAFFIVLSGTYAGMASADRDSLLLARLLGASRAEVFRKFTFPAAVPGIFAGLQLALIYSFLGAVVGEMLGGTQGLGAQLQEAESLFETPDFFAQLTVLVVVTLIIAALIRLVERRLLRWRLIELRMVGR